MQPVLEVRHMTKIYKRSGRAPVRAVDDVSFRLMPGEILGIVGESGSGKSTLARLITRLEDVTEGKLLIGGEDVTAAKGGRLRGLYDELQMVFQCPMESFDPRRALGDGIGESLRNRGVCASERKARVGKLLEQCGLPSEFAQRYPHEVSGGQCQRAAIARALACEPKIIILDEATSALDVTVQKQIVELLCGIQKSKNLSFLFICHNLFLVQQICDRVLVMKDGKIVEEGTPYEVIFTPNDAYTRQLAAETFYLCNSSAVL